MYSWRQQGLCPGTTVYRWWGRDRRTVRGRNSIFHHSPWERNGGGEGQRGGGHPSNSARDRQTYRVLSRYSVHRINPQCVLTNTTQLPPHWFRVCRRSPLSSRSTPSDPRPQALKPPHRQGRPSVFSRRDAHSHAIESKTLLQTGTGWERAAGIWCWAVRRGWARGACRSYTIKLEVFG